MPDLARPEALREEGRESYHGFVVTPPEALAEPFTVVLPDFDSTRVFEVRYWTARGATLPAEDDLVLIVIDDRLEPWCVSWWPSGGDVAGFSTGDLKTTARPSAPAGWLMCEGQAISRTTYAALFAAIGTAYGPGNGSTTFNVPDMRGRVPVGVDGAAGRLTEKDALGESGGTEKHKLTSAESGVPAHSHGLTNGATEFPANGSSGTNYAAASGASYGFRGSQVAANAAADAAQSHPNMQPFQIVNYLVKT